MKHCMFGDCTRQVYCRELCMKHYEHMREGRLGTVQERERHGMEKTPEYVIWKAMKQRCHNPNHKDYHNYGGRGIQVCERWRNSFKTFYEDIGPRPSNKYSIERINNDGNYEPGNVKWATRHEQSINQRVRKINTSGERNISWHKQSRKWRVRVSIEGKTVEIGRHSELNEAIRVRDTFLLQYEHGNREFLRPAA